MTAILEILFEVIVLQIIVLSVQLETSEYVFISPCLN